MPQGNVLIWAIGGVLIVVALVFVMAQVFNLWVQGVLSGARVPMRELIGMKYRRVDPQVIVLNHIQLVKAGLDISAHQLETHHLAGGRVPLVARALIVADRAKRDLDFETACAIDLAGRDVFEEIKTMVARIGARGRAMTDLRPGGTIRLDGEDVEAFAESDFVDAGREVVITSIVDQRINVRGVVGAESA